MSKQFDCWVRRRDGKVWHLGKREKRHPYNWVSAYCGNINQYTDDTGDTIEVLFPETTPPGQICKKCQKILEKEEK